MIISILHLSDLHRDPGHPLTNAALIESLERDRGRYAHETPTIKPPDLIFVCGDLVSGVQPTIPDATAELARQYREAEAFLSALAERFLAGNRKKIIISPGNHDVSYPHVNASLKKIDLEGGVPEKEEACVRYSKMLSAPDSNLRWSWKELCFYEVVNPESYRRRFEPFTNFYHRFYGGTCEFSLDPEGQFNIFEYPELGIIVIAFNSCHNNDPLNGIATIHPDCIAHAYHALRDDRFVGQLRVGLWHHNITGPPTKMDYLDSDILQVLIDYGFSLGFHGHQHKPHFIDERFLFGNDRNIKVISAGTLCGGRDALPTGQPRSYNIIQLDNERFTGTLHVRQMLNANLSSPIWGPGLSPSREAFIEFKIQPPPGFGEDRTMFILAEAERCLSTKNPIEAIRLVSPFVEKNDIARRLILDALVQTGDTKDIIKFLYPPRSTREIIFVADALFQEGRFEQLRTLLNDPFVRDSSDASIVTIRDQYSKRLKK